MTGAAAGRERSAPISLSGAAQLVRASRAAANTAGHLPRTRPNGVTKDTSSAAAKWEVGIAQGTGAGG